MHFNNPFKGKQKLVTGFMFAALGGLLTACYYRAIDIGKSEVVEEVLKLISENGECLITGKYDDGKRIKVKCSLYEEEENADQ